MNKKEIRKGHVGTARWQCTWNLSDLSSFKIAGHPRNDVMQEKTFLTVEKQNGEDWTIVATDANWETR